MPRRLPDLAARIPIRIHHKLLAAFAIIVALLVVLGAVGLNVLHGSNLRTDELLRLQSKIAAYQQLQNDTTAQLHRITSVLAAPNQQNLDAMLRQLEQFRYDVERLEFVAKEELAMHGRMQAARKRFARGVSEVVARIRAGELRENRTPELEAVARDAERLDRAIRALITLAEAEMIDHAEGTRRAYAASQATVVGFAIGSMGLALALGYALSGSLLGPVRLMAERMREIAAGDFSRRVELVNRDELGSFGADLNRMNDELARLYKEREMHIRFLRRTFGRYLSDDVVSSLIDSPQGLVLGGERRKVTLLMSDLRGFTSQAEVLQPEQVVSLLNRYLGVMTEVILEHQGTIDEFIGDAIFVIFGAPLPRDDDAKRAVSCAVAMQLRMGALNADNRRDGLPEVAMGIGVHTGEVVVGNIGSDRRAKYGVVGRNVNLTSRIESCTVGSQVLISEATRRELGAWVAVGEQTRVAVKGIEEPLEVYEVCGVGDGVSLALPSAAQALSPVVEAVAVRCSVLDGKSMGENRFDGFLCRLSQDGGEIASDRSLEPFRNIRLEFPHFPGRGAWIYGKVLKHRDTAASTFFVRFTAVSPPAAALLRTLTVSNTNGAGAGMSS